MIAKHKPKHALLLAISICILINVFISTVSAVPTIDPGDGVWTDNFEDNFSEDYLELQDCELRNGSIVLEKSSESRTYDFKDSPLNHKAYFYRLNRIQLILMKLPLPRFTPENHMLLEVPFDSRKEIRGIRANDDEYAYHSSTLLRRNVVHHFRFKMGVNKDLIGDIEIIWRGKADDAEIEVYYFNNSGFLNSKWHLLTAKDSHDEDVEIKIPIGENHVEYMMNDEDYIDIIVVAKSTLTGNTLYTNHVYIISKNEHGYPTKDDVEGIAKTLEPIAPKVISGIQEFYWDILTWNDYKKTGTEIRYHVQYQNDTGVWINVENEYVPNNRHGLTTPPVYLNNIPIKEPYDQLKIMANFSTTDPRYTPEIHSWSITWQHPVLQWRDLFNSTFRTDVRNKVKLSNGHVNISPISSEWTSIHHNSFNTRATETNGLNNHKDYWFYYNDSYTESIYTPVISNGILYFSMELTNKLIYCTSAIISEDDDKKPDGEFVFQEIEVEKEIGSTPLLSEEYIIIATGDEDNDGTKNYVYAYDISDPDNLVGTFSYEENLCYSASPAIQDDTVIITTWSGDPDLLQSNTNNKVFALKLPELTLQWEHSLPAGGYSTPAIANDTIIVACKNKEGNSLFALDLQSGDDLWNLSIGAVQKASPVIYNDKIYILSKSDNKIKLNVISFLDGSLLWDKQICSGSLVQADTTPAIYDDVIYIATPEGDVLALKAENGDEIWSESICSISYNDKVNGKYQKTSPTYADEMIYIGTPKGDFYTLNADDGSQKYTPYHTIPDWGSVGIVTSPVIYNGLAYFGDENGIIYCIGEYIEPETEIDGKLISIPIQLPEKHWWDKFYADYSVTKNVNSIKFSILDENKNKIKDIKNGESILIEDLTNRVIRLQAVMEADNLSVNPQLNDWSITFTKDNSDPHIIEKSFKPQSEGWINYVPTEFSVNVIDNGTGLNIGSAVYKLSYTDKNNNSKQTTQKAYCTGENATTEQQKIIANISKLDFYENISSLQKIIISISDLADNSDSITVEFKQDSVPPESHIQNQSLKSAYNTSTVRISGIASDPGVAGENASGIKVVELYFRHSLTNEFPNSWELYKGINSTKPTWDFEAVAGGGYYELCTVAVDNAGNVEEKPTSGDVVFIFDPNKPNIPDLPDVYWFNETPEISIEFKDDFKLDRIEYRPNFETIWSTIADNINKAVYSSTWELEDEHWQFMDEGENYYLYFRIKDSLGNTYITPSKQDALLIKKDSKEPFIHLSLPDIETKWISGKSINISAFTDDQNGSGIGEVSLFYRFSEDKESWTNWTLYDKDGYASDYIWSFKADEGNGYYQFRVDVRDIAGNAASQSIIIGVNRLPTDLLIPMVLLIIFLIFIFFVLVILWKKKK